MNQRYASNINMIMMNISYIYISYIYLYYMFNMMYSY